MTQQERPLWSNYILERLVKEGVAVARKWVTTPPAEPLGPQAALYYEAESPHVLLEFGIKFEPFDAEVEELASRSDALYEWVNLALEPGGDSELVIEFKFGQTTAELVIVDARRTHSAFTLPYVEGVAYDPKTVLDDLLGVLLSDGQADASKRRDVEKP